MCGNLQRSNCSKVLRDMNAYYNKLFIEGWVLEYEQGRSEEIYESILDFQQDTGNSN